MRSKVLVEYLINHKKITASVISVAILLCIAVGYYIRSSSMQPIWLGNAVNDILTDKEKAKGIKYILVGSTSRGLEKNIDAADFSVAVESGAAINENIYTAIYSCDQPASRNGRATLNCLDINNEYVFIECDENCRKKLSDSGSLDPDDQPMTYLIGRIVDNYGYRPIIKVE